MLLQTNSYIVPKERRAEHARLVQRFRHTMRRLGCEGFEVYEQVGAQWGGGETTGRFVQIMRFIDRRHQQAVQRAEQHDAAAQALIREFCDLVNMDYQRQQGLFASGYYQGVMTAPPAAESGGKPATSEKSATAATNGSAHAGDRVPPRPAPTPPAPAEAIDDEGELFVDPDADAPDFVDAGDDDPSGDSGGVAPASADDTAAAFGLDPDGGDPDEVDAPAPQ